MTCSLRVSSSDSHSLMFSGVLSRLSNCSSPIVVGMSPWSCWGSIIIMSVHSIAICGAGPTGEGACPWFKAASTASGADVCIYPWTWGVDKRSMPALPTPLAVSLGPCVLGGTGLVPSSCFLR